MMTVKSKQQGRRNASERARSKVKLDDDDEEEDEDDDDVRAVGTGQTSFRIFRIINTVN